MKKKITATVLSQKEIAPRIFDMWIATDLAEQAKAGQFIGVYRRFMARNVFAQPLCKDR